MRHGKCYDAVCRELWEQTGGKLIPGMKPPTLKVQLRTIRDSEFVDLVVWTTGTWVVRAYMQAEEGEYVQLKLAQTEEEPETRLSLSVLETKVEEDFIEFYVHINRTNDAKKNSRIRSLFEIDWVTASGVHRYFSPEFKCLQRKPDKAKRTYRKKKDGSVEEEDEEEEEEEEFLPVKKSVKRGPRSVPAKNYAPPKKNTPSPSSKGEASNPRIISPSKTSPPVTHGHAVEQVNPYPISFSNMMSPDLIDYYQPQRYQPPQLERYEPTTFLSPFSFPQQKLDGNAEEEEEEEEEDRFSNESEEQNTELVIEDINMDTFDEKDVPDYTREDRSDSEEELEDCIPSLNEEKIEDAGTESGEEEPVEELKFNPNFSDFLPLICSNGEVVQASFPDSYSPNADMGEFCFDPVGDQFQYFPASDFLDTPSPRELAMVKKEAMWMDVDTAENAYGTFYE